MVRHGRSDLDCRVVATSRRVAPTECDSRLPLFGRGSTCRLRLLDSWPPPGSGVVFDSSRGSTRVSRPVAQTESDSSDYRPRHTSHDRGGYVGQSGPTRPTRPTLVGLCRMKMSRGTRDSRQTRPRSKVPDSSTRQTPTPASPVSCDPLTPRPTPVDAPRLLHPSYRYIAYTRHACTSHTESETDRHPPAGAAPAARALDR